LIGLARENLDCLGDDIRYTTNRMIASCFYFDPIADSFKRDSAGQVGLQGYIRCRFQGVRLQDFGVLLRQRCREAFNSVGGGQHSPCFVLEDRSRPKSAEQVLLSDNMITGMTEQFRFMCKVTIKVAYSNAEYDLHLRFGGESGSGPNNSISGFPKCWDDRKTTPMTSHLNLSDSRARMPSRRGRPGWVEPTTATIPVLGKYARMSNPGLATDAELRAVQGRLTDQVPLQLYHELEVGYQVLSSRNDDMSIPLTSVRPVELPAYTSHSHRHEMSTTTMQNRVYEIDNSSRDPVSTQNSSMLAPRPHIPLQDEQSYHRFDDLAMYPLSVIAIAESGSLDKPSLPSPSEDHSPLPRPGHTRIPSADDTDADGEQAVHTI